MLSSQFTIIPSPNGGSNAESVSRAVAAVATAVGGKEALREGGRVAEGDEGHVGAPCFGYPGACTTCNYKQDLEEHEARYAI